MSNDLKNEISSAVSRMSQDESNPRRVAVLIETTTMFSRGIIRGIFRYWRENTNWRIHLLPGGIDELKMPDMNIWGGAGIIGRVVTSGMAKNIVQTKLPCVFLNLSDEFLKPVYQLTQFPEIRVNAVQVVKLAMEHLMEIKPDYFGYVREAMNHNWSQRREKAMSEYLTAQGQKIYIYDPKIAAPNSNDWSVEQKYLTDWLLSLPKPIGLLSANDFRGKQILDACRAAAIRVPDEIAVISVDNDSLVSNCTEPPLTSVSLNAFDAGYRAAKCLNEMIDTRHYEHQIIPVEPIGVVRRQSTDILRMDDVLVAKALRLIRERALTKLVISEIPEQLDVSRRTLEIRFKKILGHTIRQEIERQRLEQVKEYLIESDLPMHKIAQKCRFPNESYLSYLFHKVVGLSMSEYRTINKSW
jgi:LacI family transcriptional regulator